MKKFILSLIFMLMCACGVNAQVATENSKVFDNVYVGAIGGVSTPLDFNSVFPLNPAFGLKVGKEFTPYFGLEAEGIAVLNDNHFADLKTTVKSTNVGVNGVFNLTNIFKGYNGKPRVFEIKTNTGLGWLYMWNSNISALSAKTGVDFAFNIGSKRAHSIVITPVIYWNLDKFTSIQFNKHNAQFGVFASYVYHFKTSNGTHSFKTYDVGAMVGEIDRLNEELAKKPVREEIIKYIEKPVKEVTTVNVTDAYVFFAYNSAELDNRAKEELNKLGQNGIYDIIAFASVEGTAKYNLDLSQRRADAVKEYLEARGCKINSSVGKGVQFGTTTGRVAIVSAMR